MRIGFYFECKTKSGGAYQYALNMLDILKGIKEHQYVVFNISPDFPYHLFKLSNWQIVDLIPVAKKSEDVKVTATENMARDLSFRRQFNLMILGITGKLRLHRLEMLLTKMNAKRRAKRFEEYDLDLMLYHGPSELSFLTKIPGIVPIHDIEHRLHKNEFPELSDRGQCLKREYLYKNIKKSAYRILVDSEISKTDIMKEYGIESERIAVMPFVATTYLNKNPSEADKANVKNKFSLPDRFLYYPAQLWPHKNHISIVRAIALLKERGLRIDVVFSGNFVDLWGEYGRLKTFIKENGIEDRVYFLGFVDAKEISALYSMAEAMIMPVLMGPTYIPVYEAWYMGCPVIYSDIRGPREQAAGAALLVNPRDPEDIARKIREVWGNRKLRLDLINKGKARLAEWTPDDFRNSIRNIIYKLQKNGR